METKMIANTFYRVSREDNRYRVSHVAANGSESPTQTFHSCEADALHDALGRAAKMSLLLSTRSETAQIRVFLGQRTFLVSTEEAR
jgi:hypothetical protein